MNVSMHLSEVEIARFLTARAAPWERQRVVKHLLAGCGICSRRLVERAPDRLLDEAQESRGRRASRDPLRDHTVATALEQDSCWRPDDKKLENSLKLLDTYPQRYDALTFRQAQALHGKPLVEALLQKSWEARFHDPKGMRWLAYNAVKAAECLRREEYAPAEFFDLQVRAWSGLANAYKVNEEYIEAEAAFVRAQNFLRQGSGDLHLLALIAQLKSSFRSAQRRLFEARELLDRAHQVYLKVGDQHRVGQTLISKGSLKDYEYSFRSAIPLFKQGLTLIDSDRDPQFTAAGRQGLIHSLVECGEYPEASRLLLKSDLRRLLADAPNVRWIEGKLLAGLGKLTKAERALRGARDEFLRRGLSNAASHVLLTLIPVLIQQRKLYEARKIAHESYGILRDLGHAPCAAMAKRYIQ